MDLALDNSLQIAGSGPAPAQSRYSTRAGTRIASGVETDESGTEFTGYSVAIASGIVGRIEGATVIAPGPLISALPPAGTLTAITRFLRIMLRSSDSGVTQAMLTGVAGVNDISSVTELLAAANAAEREQRVAS